MKSSAFALLVSVALLGSFWLAGPGCATEDETGPGACQIRATCVSGTCCRGPAGTWQVMDSTCICPDGGREDEATDARDDGGPTDARDDGVTTDDGGRDDGGPVGGGPGSACNCDSDCSGGDATHAPVCFFGVCFLYSSAPCSDFGSTVECPAHLRCWRNSSGTYNLCWPDCDFYTGCAGDCDEDGSCTPNTSTSCDGTCGGICS